MSLSPRADPHPEAARVQGGGEEHGRRVRVPGQTRPVAGAHRHLAEGQQGPAPGRPAVGRPWCFMTPGVSVGTSSY